MLRVTDDGRRPLSGIGRAVVAAVLVGIGVGVTALRGPAQAQPVAAPAKAEGELPPFDLSLMPRGTNGVFAMRPAVLVAEAGGKAADDLLVQAVKQALANTGFPPDFDLPLSQMEQVVGPAILTRHDKPLPSGATHSASLGVSMVRMAPGFNWPAKLRERGPAMKLKEVSPGVWQLDMPALKYPTFRVIDERTIAFQYDETTGAPAESPDQRFGPDWSDAEKGSTFVIALDNRKGDWTKSLEGKPELALVVALGNPQHVVIAGPAGPTVGVNCSLAFAEAGAAEKGTAQTQVLAQVGDAALAVLHPVSSGDIFFARLAGELLAGRSVRRDGDVVRAEFRSKTSVAGLLKAFADGAKSVAVEGSEKPKK